MQLRGNVTGNLCNMPNQIMHKQPFPHAPEDQEDVVSQGNSLEDNYGENMGNHCNSIPCRVPAKEHGQATLPHAPGPRKTRAPRGEITESQCNMPAKEMKKQTFHMSQGDQEDVSSQGNPLEDSYGGRLHGGHIGFL